jgi:hypothetical protein
MLSFAEKWVPTLKALGNENLREGCGLLSFVSGSLTI